MLRHSITIKNTELEPTLAKIQTLINTHIPKPWDQYLNYGPSDSNFNEPLQDKTTTYTFYWHTKDAGEDAPDTTPFWNALRNIPWEKEPTCTKTKRITIKNTDGAILAILHGTVERIRQTNGVTITID
jgi:hypothetical protein